MRRGSGELLGDVIVTVVDVLVRVSTRTSCACTATAVQRASDATKRLRFNITTSSEGHVKFVVALILRIESLVGFERIK